MKKLWLLCFCFLPSFAAFGADLNLMVLGDSLSAGHQLGPKESFAHQLEDALVEKGYSIHVTNLSFSGATSADGVRRLKNALSKKPNAVILQLGANDMLRKLDLKKTKENLQEIISTFKQKDIPVFLAGMEASIEMPEEYRTNFRQMYEDLALDNELLLYPFFMQGLWKDDGSHMKEEYFLPDKMHPSAKGVAVMVKHILPAVEQFLAEDVTPAEEK